MYVYINLREEPYDVAYIELFRQIKVLSGAATEIIVGLSGKDLHERATLFNTCGYVYMIVTNATTKAVSDFINTN